MSEEANKARSLSNSVYDIIDGLGYDSSDPHLKGSPERVAKFFQEWHTINRKPPTMTTFPNKPVTREPVVVGDLKFYSMCAHHGLPFHGEATVVYIPNERVIGLSKIARAIDHFSHRYQVQERLTVEIADFLQATLEPLGLGVIMRGEHLCMSMRGIRKPGHLTTTSTAHGSMSVDDSRERAEFILLRNK